MKRMIEGLREIGAHHERVEGRVDGELAATSLWFANVALQAADELERLAAEAERVHAALAWIESRALVSDEVESQKILNCVANARADCDALNATEPADA